MIKATELRIGNLAFEKDNGVITIDGAMIKWIEEGSYQGIEPIALTEEWLEKFGFEKDNLWQVRAGGAPYDVYKLKSNERIAILTSAFNSWDYMEFFLGSNSRLPHPKLKYAHQLQNLYFALTGNELTIQEYSIK